MRISLYYGYELHNIIIQQFLYAVYFIHLLITLVVFLHVCHGLSLHRFINGEWCQIWIMFIQRSVCLIYSVTFWFVYAVYSNKMYSYLFAVSQLQDYFTSCTCWWFFFLKINNYELFENNRCCDLYWIKVLYVKRIWNSTIFTPYETKNIKVYVCGRKLRRPWKNKELVQKGSNVWSFHFSSS